ncbi:F-box/kelch-repeat protein At3g23880-like [Quercus suber]|uniref:F-box/kelch-repeat protein At3g23880-like n=1 Tax=Quercus suber TaxID=58331 RepID=UPI000CE28923|nr:F-box/kelch-repeat protein At3g23880-like [Quercus suber]
MSQTREAPILRRRKNDLPLEIVLNILTRLPAKSVIRFRCVCKPWNSSITSSYFISTHLNNFAHAHDIDNDNDNGDGYIIHMPWDANSSNRVVCTVALDRTFDRISEIEVPFNFPFGSIKIVGSCNGLLCLAGGIGGFPTTDKVIYLWNPSIRKFKRLPDSCLGKLDFVKFGFAYHSENNDYKVLRILSYPMVRPPIPDKIEVYTLSSDSWRRVGMSLRASVMVRDYCSRLPFPLVSGALHWISLVVEGEEERKSEVIMSFDVNSEKFRMLRMPDGSMLIVRFQIGLVSFKGKLAFLTFGKSEPHGGYYYSIWVMREYGMLESWNKIFVVPFQRLAVCIAFTMHGSLLIHCLDLPNQEQKFVLVDAETLHEKDFDIQQPSCVASFIESLALLDGANMLSY